MTAADGVRFARQGYDGAAAAWAPSSYTGRWPMRCWRAHGMSPDGSCWMWAPAPERSPVGSPPRELTLSRSTPRGRCSPMASSRPPAVVGDISRLPLVDGAADGAAAAFVLNHLAYPPWSRWLRCAESSAGADSSWPQCSRPPPRRRRSRRSTVRWPPRDGNHRTGTGSSSRSKVNWALRPACASRPRPPTLSTSMWSKDR